MPRMFLRWDRPDVSGGSLVVDGNQSRIVSEKPLCCAKNRTATAFRAPRWHSELKREDRRKNAVHHELAVTWHALLPVCRTVRARHQHTAFDQCLGHHVMVEAGTD